jgi:acyl dehydratase
MTVDESTTRVFAAIDEFRAARGEVLGVGDWLEITQERIDAGATIAHGYLTLSLIPRLGGGIFAVHGARMALNYGTNRVRFPHPVTVGSRIRAVAGLVEVTDVAAGVQAVVLYTVEIEGCEKPACVAETVRVLIP